MEKLKPAGEFRTRPKAKGKTKCDTLGLTGELPWLDDDASMFLWRVWGRRTWLREKIQEGV